MRALVLDPDPEWLAERRRLGLDKRDEVWDGVLHVVPPPSFPHQHLERELYEALRTVVKTLGLELIWETGVFDPIAGERNYRTPDLLIFDPRYVSQRGIEGRLEVTIEVLSPNDESREKLPFFAKWQHQEVWLVEPKTRVVEVHVLRGDEYAMTDSSRGPIAAPRLGLTLETLSGPKLRIAWSDGFVDV
jgi:Uma2 family endonuclease